MEFEVKKSFCQTSQLLHFCSQEDIEDLMGPKFAVTVFEDISELSAGKKLKKNSL